MARYRDESEYYEYEDIEDVKEYEREREYPFLSNLSHEVRTPMNAIIGISDMLLARTADNEQKEQLVSLKAATQNLLMVINNIIDYDEMSQGKLVRHRESVKLEEVMSDVIDMARINIGDKDVLFVVELNPELPKYIMLDTTRVKQALVYYLTNAAKCTKWGYIALVVDYADKKKRSIRFEVENTSPGFPIMEDLIKYLGSNLKIEKNDSGGINIYFDVDLEVPEDVPEETEQKPIEAYFGVCLKNAREKASFALYFSKAKIDYVEIDNPTELFILKEDERPDYLILEYDRYRKIKDVKEFRDLGTKLICLVNYNDTVERSGDTIFLKRPFFYPQLRDYFTDEKERDGVGEVYFEGARVLVVDDNAINLKVTTGLLQPYRLKIDKATGGEEAIRMIHRTRYDLVFMDHMMPQMDGTEATKVIRQAQDDYYRKLPIIALTANVLDDSRKLFAEAGMSDFLPKPIELKKLEAMLKKWIPESKHQKAEDDEYTHFYTLPDLSSLNLSHITPSKGLSYTGENVKMYSAILEDFKKSAPLKKTLLSSLLENEDIGRYTIEVHALKSLAATIGAEELNYKAAELEKKGHLRDLDAIETLHEGLIDEFEEVEKEISSIVDSLKPKEKKVPLLREKAGEILRDLFHAMNDFDYDTAEKTIKELDKYEYDSLVAESFERLKDCVDRIDYEATKKQAIEMISLL